MTHGSAVADAGVSPQKTGARVRSPVLEVCVRMVREKPLGVIGACIVVALLGVAIFADVLAPYGYAQTSLLHRFRGSSMEHWLGTDQLGRDLLSRIIYGTRVSLTVSLGARPWGYFWPRSSASPQPSSGAAMTCACSVLSMRGNPSPVFSSCSRSCRCWVQDSSMSQQCWG